MHKINKMLLIAVICTIASSAIVQANHYLLKKEIKKQFHKMISDWDRKIDDSIKTKQQNHGKTITTLCTYIKDKISELAGVISKSLPNTNKKLIISEITGQMLSCMEQDYHRLACYLSYEPGTSYKHWKFKTQREYLLKISDKLFSNVITSKPTPQKNTQMPKNPSN